MEHNAGNIRVVDGTEEITLCLEFPFAGEKIEEVCTLKDLFWSGEQGVELEEFMEQAYKEWAFNMLDGYIKFSDEEE